MATLKLGTTTVMTESSGVISDIPAAGVTGTLPNAVQDNVTRLGTVTAGDISHADIVYPAGHIIQTKYVSDIGSTNKGSERNIYIYSA